MAKHEKHENQEEARVRVAAEQGIDGPAPHDGTHTGDTHPQYGPEPGVTELPDDGDESVPAFIQDEVGPHVEGAVERTVGDRAEESAHPAKRVEHAREDAKQAAKQAERPAVQPAKPAERPAKRHEA